MAKVKRCLLTILVTMDLIHNDIKNKNGSCSVGILHESPMERLVFLYDRHEEITKYIQMRHIYYHPTVMHVFCLPLKFWLVLLFQMPYIEYNLILNIFVY